MTQNTDEIGYDPFGVGAMTDPLPFYRQLRDRDPVHYLPAYDTFAISRFEDVWDVLGDTSGTFVSSESSLPSPDTLRMHNPGAVPDPPTAPIGSANMFGSPVYEEFRQAQGRPLRPGSVRRLGDLVSHLARTRLEELLERGDEFDLAQEYGGHVSAGMICHLLGLPMQLTDEVREIVNTSTSTHDRSGGGLDKKLLFSRSVETLLPVVAKHRAARESGADYPDDGTVRSGLVDGLLDMEFGGRRLDDREIAVNLVCVFVGGTETVPKVTAHGLWELAKDPAQLATVRSDLATNVPKAREEFIRYCAPAQWFLRTVRRPTEVAGVAIRPGQRVMMLMGSAARDEREFDAPDEFRWDRTIERVLSFGRGQHFCIGFHLARLEIDTLVTEFLGTVASYEVLADRAVRYPSSFQWGWSSVPVRAIR